jgi:hypothetical protein
MNFAVLLHVRDHSKTVGSARHLLLEIATHINYHSGLTRLSVDRLAHRLHVGARHVRKLLAVLEASGELVIWRTTGRHANTYQIATQGCAACEARANPALRARVDFNRGSQGQVHPRNPGSQDRQPGLPGPTIKKSLKEDKPKDAARSSVAWEAEWARRYDALYGEDKR